MHETFQVTMWFAHYAQNLAASVKTHFKRCEYLLFEAIAD
jgi:hypothetical protein